MNQTKKAEIKVGISVIVSLIIIIFVIAWAKNISFFNDNKNLTVRFDKVAGLEPGDMVSVNGVRKGYVDNIGVDGNQVLVDIILDPDVPLKNDAAFSIMMLDLMGGKKIEVSPGTSAEPLDYSFVYQGKFLGDISTAMATLSSVEGDLKTIITELKVTLNSVNKLLDDGKFGDEIKTGISKLNRLADKMAVVIEENRQGLKSLIDSSRVLVSTSNQFLSNNQKSLTETIEGTKELVGSSNSLVAKIEAFLDETSNKKNNLGKILYDEELIDNLKSSLAEVKKLTKILVEQLEGEGVNVDANIF